MCCPPGGTLVCFRPYAAHDATRHIGPKALGFDGRALDAVGISFDWVFAAIQDRLLRLLEKPHQSPALGRNIRYDLVTPTNSTRHKQRKDMNDMEVCTKWNSTHKPPPFCAVPAF